MIACLLISLSACGPGIAGPIFYSLNWLYTIFVVVPFSLTFLSLAYQHFFENEKQ